MMLIRWLLILALACAPASAQVGGLAFPGSGPIHVSGGGCSLSTAIDGAAANATFNSPTVSFTPAQNNDILVAAVWGTNGTETVSGGGLTWTLVTGTGVTSNKNPSLWWALQTTAAAITVTASTGQGLIAFGISGANTTSPFDGTPTGGTSNSTNPNTYTTSLAGDFVFALTSNFSATTDSGWSLIANGASTVSWGEYRANQTAGTYTANWAAAGTGNSWFMGAVKCM